MMTKTVNNMKKLTYTYGSKLKIPYNKNEVLIKKVERER